MKRNVIIALVLTTSLATGIGAGFIYSNHVAKSMVSNNVVATEQNAASEASKSEDVAARENAKNVSSDKKAADTKTDKTSAKAADKKTKTEKTAAKASVNKQNTQKAVKAKTENHKAAAKSENNTDRVLITAEPKKEEAAIQKTALKTAEEKKAENSVKAEIEMSEEEWSKIADQRMRERYEESMRFCAENMNKDADDEEGENVSEEEWNEIVEQRMRERYEASMPVDSIVCLDGMQVVGTYLAEELTKVGILSYNAHKTLYVLSPEYSAAGQIIFRDNMQMAIKDKYILVLMGSVTTGKTLQTALDCIRYYKGKVSGACAIFSAVSEVEGVELHAIFHPDDINGFSSYRSIRRREIGNPVYVGYHSIWTTHNYLLS